MIAVDLATINRLRLALFAAGLLCLPACEFFDNTNGPNGLAIKKFTVSPAEVAAGGAATLSWDVEGAESIQVDNGVGAVDAKGSVELKVNQATTYKITARAGTSVATATVQLLVGPGKT